MIKFPDPLYGGSSEIATYVYENRKLILANKKQINSTKKYMSKIIIINVCY